MIKKLIFIFILLLSLGILLAQEKETPTQVLFTNVNIWDGIDEDLKSGMSVLVENNLIKQISENIAMPTGATVIDARGKILMPGLIDMHTHIMFKYGVTVTRTDFDHASSGAAAMETMQQYLSMGYTTLRDVGGNSLGIARNVAAGRLKGPRIYSAGGAISTISGHNDLAMLTEDPHEDVFSKRHDTNVATVHILN
jgi:imidazolonepropionase-like amidohydrolase